MKNEQLKTAVRVAISLIILILIINTIGIEKITEGVTKIKLEYFVLILITLSISTVLTTLAVIPILKTNRIFKIFKFKAISWSTGMFLPSKIGEISFPLLLKKINIPAKKAFAIFFIDRFVSLSIISAFAVIGSIKYFEIKIDLNYLSLFIAIFSIMFIFKNKIKNMKLIKLQLIEDLKTYLEKEKKAIVINYFFSLMNFILIFWVTKVIFISIGESVSLIDIGLISSIALLISLVPITISGLGLREGILIYLYSLIGVEPESSILIAFVFLVSSYLLAGIFLIAFSDEITFILERKQKN